MEQIPASTLSQVSTFTQHFQSCIYLRYIKYLEAIGCNFSSFIADFVYLKLPYLIVHTN